MPKKVLHPSKIRQAPHNLQHSMEATKGEGGEKARELHERKGTKERRKSKGIFGEVGKVDCIVVHLFQAVKWNMFETK